MTLVDTNILLDLFTKDPVWARWSINQLDVAAARGPLIINDVVYAELSVRFSDIRALDTALDTAALRLEPTPRTALFLAGRVFQRYRAAGGSRTGVLPDFFIGAHAAVAGWPLVTRDMRRYRTYFPRLVLITP
ncbi:MAG TPA: type II toxin-antitoxin system VapC family toxin [Caulobacteraceae bacterium]